MLAIEIYRAVDIPPDQMLPITKQILGNQRAVRAVDEDIDTLLGHGVLGNHQRGPIHAPTLPPQTRIAT